MAFLQNRSSSGMHFRFPVFSGAENCGSDNKNVQKNSLKELVVRWIQTIFRQTKYFGRPFTACVGKAQVPLFRSKV